ncbi:MAG: EAL domain-containing protein [Devosia sp.]
MAAGRASFTNGQPGAGRHAGPALPPSSVAPFGRKPLRTFALFVAAPAIVIYIASAALSIGGLIMMATEINRLDDHRTAQAISGALDAFVSATADAVGDEGAWDEAYLRTVVSLDPAWLDGTWGTTARAGTTYNDVLLTDAEGNILFGENEVGALTGIATSYFSGAVSTLADLDAAIAESGDSSVVSRFDSSPDGLIAMAATSVHKIAPGSIAVPRDKRRVLWIARHLSGDVLKGFAESARVPEPRLAPANPETASSVPIADPSGTVLGRLEWTPGRPGDGALFHALLLASSLLFVIGLGLAFTLSLLRRAILNRAARVTEACDVARRDVGTGRLNQFGLLDSLDALVARLPAPASVVIAAIGIENYRDIVAAQGEAGAEDFMRALALVMAREAGSGVILARVAEDRFALAAAGNRAEGTIKHLARRISHVAAEPIEIGGEALRATLATGVASGSCVAPALTLSSASAALRAARSAAGSGLVSFTVAEDSARLARLEMASELRRAIAAEQFQLEYQPVFDVRAQTLVGVEALLRWRRDNGMVQAADFVPVADAVGLLDEIGLAALRRALREILPFDGMVLSLNITTSQFDDARFLERLAESVKLSGFPLARLQIELEQSLLDRQPERAAVIIARLHASGVRVALDDFTIGPATLNYLQEFRFDRVNLARVIVSGIDVDESKRALAEATIRSAHMAGLAVTAVGVERAQEVASLLRLGCNEFQGFLFARPLSIEALGKLVAGKAAEAETRLAG